MNFCKEKISIKTVHQSVDCTRITQRRTSAVKIVHNFQVNLAVFSSFSVERQYHICCMFNLNTARERSYTLNTGQSFAIIFLFLS
jgi:hypothetical protein